ncbi:MAG: hypothetical protein KJN87_03400 [Desulfofustis sp.]|nr:hypothetical protein [Desulfofustis sp.]
MKPLYPSLLFPDTDIFGYRQLPLLLFGCPLNYLQPVEPSPDDDTSADNTVIIDSGLCNPHIPAPLDADRAKFTRLIHDIRERKDDYAAQLSALTMAAMSEKKEKSGGEERYQIISSLLGNKLTAGSADGDEQLDLWQARLVLAIAEILKKEKEDLLQEMQLLDAQEIEMLRSLQGETGTEDEDPFAELQRIKAGLDDAHPREVKIRFQSWLRLMKRAPLPDTKLWLASSPEAADELFDEFEKSNNGAPLPILELTIPDRIEAGPIYVVSRVNSFLEDSANLRVKIIAELEALISSAGLSSDSADNLLPSGSEHSSLWAEMIEDHFPSGSHGSATLLFYLLPNCAIATLLGLEHDKLKDQHPHGLVAVLKR